MRFSFCAVLDSDGGLVSYQSENLTLSRQTVEQAVQAAAEEVESTQKESGTLSGLDLRYLAKEQDGQLRIAFVERTQETPLTVILANTGILLSHPQDTIRQQERWVVNTQEEAVNMKKLVDEMLYLARTDASLQLVYSQINLSDVVWSTVLPFESVMSEYDLA